MVHRNATTSSFCKRLLSCNKYFREGDFWVTGEYEAVKSKIEIQSKYGICDVVVGSLLGGSPPSILSARDPFSYWVSRAREVHGYKYLYLRDETDIKAASYIDIICREHGIFNQRASRHLAGSGCPRCVHEESPGGWNHSSWKKQGQNSDTFDSFKVYIIKCWDAKEEFYKIGRTFNTVKYRFIKNGIPYSYEVVSLVSSDSSKYVFELENKLQNYHKDKKYIPQKDFLGRYECFSELKPDYIKIVKDNF